MREAGALNHQVISPAPIYFNNLSNFKKIKKILCMNVCLKCAPFPFLMTTEDVGSPRTGYAWL